jgi:dihydropteroate synthase
MLLRARTFEFAFPRPVLVMGILNVTPDSFSDGGDFQEPSAAIDHALRLVEEGADLLDLGGESSRPGATPVEEQEELRRVLPVLESLVPRVRVPISIDTMKPAVARAALEAGASIINDVAANRTEPSMWELAGQYGAGYIAMHMQGRPQSMQENPCYGDAVADVNAFFGDRLERLEAAGVKAEQVILDVGIGFGKDLPHNLQLLAGLGSFTKWGRPLLLGASRKAFIGRITGVAQARERLAGSLACACWAARAGVQVVRAHDVAATKQAVQMTETILATSRHARITGK